MKTASTKAAVVAASQAKRVEAGIPFVEALARRMAATMPHSIDLSDLVQDGVIGLIDAAHRFDDSRGIKFETFAERRIRGAMIDALRKDAWPRGVRRVRRELEAAREKLRASLGHEPSLADLAQAVGSDEKRLGKTIVRMGPNGGGDPISSSDDDTWETPRHHHCFVTDLVRRDQWRSRRADDGQVGLGPFIATGQNAHAIPTGLQRLGKPEGHGRLAGTTNREIADANDIERRLGRGKVATVVERVATAHEGREPH